MEFQDEKRRLYQLIVEQGLDASWNFTSCTGVPARYVEKWIKRFFCKPAEIEFPNDPQLVNRFSLGADPEFGFLDAAGRYSYAENTGMTTILPFGCDMAGRQAELRAHSSRFALRVVASMVDALRWIPEFYKVEELKWVALPYIGNDGCGGHVHFGRKRSTRDEEVRALDAALQLLLAVGVFDPLMHEYRRRNTKYGRDGDFRLQSHGYEYRSFPTWMYSPWGSYLVLVVSKLMLHYGKVFPIHAVRAPHQLVNLLRLYRYEDDDAAIALKAWHLMGFPKPHDKCFRALWGVCLKPAPKRLIGDKYFPLSLVPEHKTCEELFSHLTMGANLKQRPPNPTWEPFELGRNYHPVMVQPHVFEIPNIAQGLISFNYGVAVAYSHSHNTVEITGTVEALNQRAIIEAFRALDTNVTFMNHSSQQVLFTFAVPKTITEDREKLRLTRQILSDTTLFPICKGEDFATTNWSHWASPTAWTAPKLQGKTLFHSQGQKLPPEPKLLYREEF